MCYEKRDTRLARECFVRDQGGKMDQYTATELAYKNGYEQGKKDAAKWISVEESLPELFGGYLVAAKDGFVGEATFCNKGWLNESSGGYFEDITHWRPLPEPPMDGGNEDG